MSGRLGQAGRFRYCAYCLHISSMERCKRLGLPNVGWTHGEICYALVKINFKNLDVCTVLKNNMSLNCIMTRVHIYFVGGGQIWSKQLPWQRLFACRCMDWCIVTYRQVVFVGVSVCARSKGETDALPAVLQRTGLLLSDSCSRSGRHTTALQVGEPPPRKKQTHISLTAHWHSLSLCLTLRSP